MSDNFHSEPIICIHGGGGGGWEWGIWLRVLISHGHRVRAEDLQPVAAGLAATRLDDYLAQVRSWRTEQPADILIGASLGGLLALQVATETPPRALVLINPLPPAAIEPRPQRRDYPDIVPWGSQRSIASTRRAMPDADDAACLFATERWRDESGAVLREAQDGVSIEPPNCSILIVASGADTDVAPATSAALALALHADLIRLPGASHVGPLLGQRAAATAQLVRGWLAAHLDG
jgi:pimeloyl-ACP methyl ester carboxylesterase